MVATTATIRREWCPVSTGSSRARLRPASTSRGRKSQRGAKRVSRNSAEGAVPAALPRRHSSRACARSECLPPQPPPTSKAGHRVKSVTAGPLTHGRAAASSKGGNGSQERQSRRRPGGRCRVETGASSRGAWSLDAGRLESRRSRYRQARRSPYGVRFQCRYSCFSMPLHFL